MVIVIALFLTKKGKELPIVQRVSVINPHLARARLYIYFTKLFQKTVDIYIGVCYTIIVPRDKGMSRGAKGQPRQPHEGLGSNPTQGRLQPRNFLKKVVRNLLTNPKTYGTINTDKGSRPTRERVSPP